SRLRSSQHLKDDFSVTTCEFALARSAGSNVQWAHISDNFDPLLIGVPVSNADAGAQAVLGERPRQQSSNSCNSGPFPPCGGGQCFRIPPAHTTDGAQGTDPGCGVASIMRIMPFATHN